MKLIGSLASPYVRKVRVVLAEKKVDYEFVLEDTMVENSAIHESNPLGKIPCLVMEDGFCMFDSRVIVEYLDTLTPVGKLLPSAGRERAVIKCWEALADGLLDAAVLIRMERVVRPQVLQSSTWVNRQMRKVNQSLKAMSENLGELAYCGGTHYSLADVAVGCALAWMSFRFPEIPWRTDYPNLGFLLDKLSDRVSFRDTIPQ